MRVFIVVIVLFLLVGMAGAQAPSAYPVGNLAQVMRANYFTQSNIIFDVQMRDPEAPKEANADGSILARPVPRNSRRWRPRAWKGTRPKTRHEAAYAARIGPSSEAVQHCSPFRSAQLDSQEIVG